MSVINNLMSAMQSTNHKEKKMWILAQWMFPGHMKDNPYFILFFQSLQYYNVLYSKTKWQTLRDS